jgi:hypothetical protein
MEKVYPHHQNGFKLLYEGLYPTHTLETKFSSMYVSIKLLAS